jgi:hypothetical protein
MNITGEMVTLCIVLLTAICSGFWAVLSKIDGVQKEISAIRENFVRHDVCKERRRECPCVKKMEEIEKVIKLEISK